MFEKTFEAMLLPSRRADAATDTRTYDLILAVIVTAMGTALAWVLVGGVPPIGIDDAAITRSYAENIANGAGYVYNVGGERVEGSTTLLWALSLALLYALTPDPSVPILLLCFALTLGAMFAILRFVRLITKRLAGSDDAAVLALSVLLIASPGYFLWSVWTMMELALWSMTILWLVLTLAAWAEGEPERSALGLIIPAIMLPLIRPEGVAVAFGLIALGTVLTPYSRARGFAALGLLILVFLSVTTFRIWYFGQPFPNTFYAKVSSDRFQDLKDGLKYAKGFVLGVPLADFFLALWAFASVWALSALRRGAPGARGLVIGASAVAGILAVYAGLGGDHFALWRFYQPIWPLMAAVGAIGFGWAATRIDFGSGAASASTLAFGAAVLAVCVAGWLHYYQARFGVLREFALTERGIDFGNHMSRIEPRPSLAIGAAGGIAMAYDGFLYDLYGLNWTEMAHAKPEKIGMRNHASFDKGVFMRHQPDIFAPFNLGCLDDNEFAAWIADAGFDGMLSEANFRDAYIPVRFPLAEEGCWVGFANREWMSGMTRGSIEIEGWR